MMKLRWQYLKTQIHRMLMRFPVLFLVTILLLGAICGLAWAQFTAGKDEEDFQSLARQKVSVAVVGDTSESYLGIGIYAVEHMDSSRFSVNFIDCTEEEARAMLEAEEVEAYLLIPEGFLDAVTTAENKPVTLVIGGNQGGIGVELVRELADMVSRVLTSSQTAIYTLVDVEANYGRNAYDSKDVTQINLRYFDVILSREEMYQKETVESVRTLSRIEYYACAGVVLFLLLWGLNGTLLLTKRDFSLPKLIRTRGVGAVSQVTAELFAYSLVLLLCLALCVGGLLFGLSKAGVSFSLPGPSESAPSFLLGLFPLVFSMAALQYFLCQLSDNPIVTLLVTLLVSLVLGYLSGCFYFLSYFPKEVQELQVYLPTGMQVNLLQSAFLEKDAAFCIKGLTGYTFLFWLCSVLIRGYRLKK
ncbi:MAG: ABC transporter permease [Lachnospiraceae bacterium]|nr:ABC transporter permease [Lachnospiraceae bacterium]